MELIKGIIAPIITPMNEDESINEKELRNQVNRLINAGIHGIFTAGTNGEGYILSEEEKEQVLSVVVEEAAKRVTIYAGTGCISTKDTIRLSENAKKIGADVLSVITPSFALASQEELYQHYKTVAQAVDLPIVLYNIPARTGNALSPDTVARLAEVDNIEGVKDSSGNFDNMLMYIEKTKGRNFSVLSGNDSLILWNLIAGGTGGIAGCSNVFPHNMVGIYENYIQGEFDKAKECQDNIRGFRNCFKFGNPNTIVKTAVALSGYPVGKCRSPFNQVSPEGIKAIREVLLEYKQLGIN
ncbi:4-hydroxy-tetrahydrodipicolinate synthase [Anaerocolumna sp. AGMB13025]|uniref:4-hydroxy-tetrahydrodipicolinate synthase n=1 Tax=Anaerocolumna sp. AGMB13025 TaxID=3039116 RepID=UPI00241FCB53|nr:4-hydroxy-tetrahydrodipicolinate synthase [Anaerocolumna sp. AGMB13025]WFR58321.1 4-hydroxy-tetrahydrodipicolinate synthase [Anaerocolumna sp. AGMB13025]